MKLTMRDKQSQPEDGDRLYSETLDAQLWRVDWKKLGYPYCGIYAISPDNQWPTKVGISQNPTKRLIGLQTACWRRLSIAEYRYVENSLAARAVEQKAHVMLAEDGVLMEGEWFDVRPDKALETIQFAALSLGIELRADIPDARVRAAISDVERKHHARLMAEIWGEMRG